MRRSAALDRSLLVALAVLVLPVQGNAQLREVVSKQIAVGASDAELVLEFSDGERLSAALRDGSVLVDDRTLGSFESGDALDASWRALLGQAIALENGPLAQAVVDWAPPESLSGEAAEAASALDETLDGALSAPASDPAQDVSVSIRNGEGALARLLVGSMTRLSVIEEALEGLGPRLSIHIEEDLDVPAGEVVEGTVLVIDGAANVAGEIRGDLVVIDGDVTLEPGSMVSGELRLADARVVRNEGTVGGGVVDVLATERTEVSELRDRIREEIRDEVRRDIRNEVRRAARSSDDGFSLFTPVRSVVRGIGGVIETIFVVLVLGLLGAAAAAFARENLEVVAETARRAPGRAAAVGLAGTFLAIPVWILGAVALVVSIVGIPVAIAWLPLFPAAVAVAFIFGYLAVAKNAGEWLADSGYEWTDWIRPSNAVHTIAAGLIGLSLAFAVAHLVSILPFFGFLSGLLTFIGVIVTLAAFQVGFGAVILTRGGRQREYWPVDPDEAWAAAMDLDSDLDSAAGAGAEAGGADPSRGGHDV
jgi:hypothetical protein